jgi:predicted transcriptional regulator
VLAERSVFNQTLDKPLRSRQVVCGTDLGKFYERFPVPYSTGGVLRGYTSGMKTAISIPDEVFEDAERLARRLKTSRSRLYSRAIAEYIARHSTDDVTEALDRVMQSLGENKDETFTSVAAARRLRRVEW